MRILLVEDDIDLAKTLAEELSCIYAVDACDTGRECLYLSDLNPYDAIILDLGLPDMGGAEVCMTLRQSGIRVPILVLTGRSDLQDKVEVLNIGADDYVVKPFHMEELVARIHALIRRGQDAAQHTLLSAGGLVLNPTLREVTYNSQQIPLRRKEFDLLEFLLRNQPKIATRQMILDHVWDSNVNSFTNAVDVHVSHLRNQIDKQFGTRLIETVYGHGYRINPRVGVDALLVTNPDT